MRLHQPHTNMIVRKNRRVSAMSLIDVHENDVRRSHSGASGSAEEPDLFGAEQMQDMVQLPGHHQVRVDRSRDALLTPFGKATLDNRYLLPDESYQDLFGRVASYYGADAEHAQRIYDYISRHWFMPATPVLSNGGTTRGLPISCFLNEANDSLKGIVDLWNENVWLASKGGGIGSYWGNLRSIGENVGRNGKTSGVIPFIRVMDSLTLAISQGSLRRGSAAVYLPVWHPEIEEFIELRRPTGGDPNRKALNLHHGILVSDAFMRAVEADDEWALLSPKDNSVIRKISARGLWIRILTARMEQGEPYIVYSDHVNNARPEHHKLAGLEVKTSNLCSEITLPTGIDHHGKARTAVCCLSSLNLETWDEWSDNPQFIEDVMIFLDNVLQDFIDRAPEDMERAKYAAMRERSVGLGVMGFHSFLQAKNVPFESVIAKVWNRKIFKHIRAQADAASRHLAELRGPCPDAEEYGIKERFSNKMAIAPTASISIIAGNASPGIEPIAANVFLQKTLSGSFTVRNRHLLKLLVEKGQDTPEVWSSITTSKGSVQHLDFLTQQEKDVFKTAFELDQRWVVEHAADRQPFICQAQSVNLFLPADVHKRDLNQIHFQAWKKGLKSLYYCRSLSIQRADTVSNVLAKSEVLGAGVAERAAAEHAAGGNNYDECLACQ
ncbi:ribonucleotide-diphosphate reductase subunit alpha [Acetobacter lovaniensis NRIC 0474]|jgi:ribonucleoside-diphosphate reductase alpha chain|nr:ribonucleotide-diphosphate reductase subunit alpha [Acetobacter lovaniensis NRIC 0474]